MFSTRLLTTMTPRGLMKLSSSSSSAVRYTTAFPSLRGVSNHSFLRGRQQGMIQNTRNLTSKTTSDAIKKGSVQAAQSSASKTAQPHGTLLQRWMGHKEIPPRGTLKWYGEMALLCTVFAITGSSTMVLVRPAVSDVLGLKGSFKDGPWSYRVCSIVIMTPVYSAMLVLVGTAFGRHFYFRHFAVKMFSRFGIPPELMDASFHKTAKNFRKYWVHTIHISTWFKCARELCILHAAWYSHHHDAWCLVDSILATSNVE